MKLIIEIDNSIYGICKSVRNLPLDENDIMSSLIMQSIANGTPLPKGHGRLIDEDEVIEWLKDKDVIKMNYQENNAREDIHKSVTTIIEADGIEVWNGIHAQITAPKGTFEKIWNEADKGEQ